MECEKCGKKLYANGYTKYEDTINLEYYCEICDVYYEAKYKFERIVKAAD